MLYNKARRYEANKVEVVKKEQSMEVSYFSTFIVFKNRKQIMKQSIFYFTFI